MHMVQTGSGDKIGPNATLVFEIELFDFIGKIRKAKKKRIEIFNLYEFR